jgi:hypothetical protein
MRIFAPIDDTLWTLIAAPAIWAAHFLFSYLLIASRCAPNAEIFVPVGGARAAVGAATLVALVLITLIFRRALREWHRRGATLQHARDSAEGREHLLEFSTMLLAALSFAAVAFDALPVLLITDCR